VRLRPGPPPSGADLDEVERLCDEGLYLQALASEARLGPLESWGGPRARVLAARVVLHAGSRRRSLRLRTCAWRESPHDFLARVAREECLAERSPYEAWRAFRETATPPGTPPRLRLRRIASAVGALLRMHDVDGAGALVDEVERSDPDAVEALELRSDVLRADDRLEDALACMERAVARSPRRWLVQGAASLEVALGRRDEAIARLAALEGRIESAACTSALASLLGEAGRLDEEALMLDRVERFSPRADPRLRERLAARRSENAFRRGDMARASAEARKAGGPFYERLAERLGAIPAGARRTALPVPIVVQRRDTCGPASLASISSYFGRSVEQDDIAARIWWGGTTGEKERRWAEDHGFAARGFRLDEASARACIDAGLPVLLSTVYTTHSHAQVVSGYDERRGTLVICDPGSPFETEAAALELLKDQAPSGPRALVLAPREEAARLTGIALADAELYERSYRAAIALERYDRPAAAREVDAMIAAAPAHAETLRLRIDLADFDGDAAARRDAALAWEAAFPHAPLPRLAAFCERSTGMTSSERLTRLEAFVAEEDADPIFLTRLAAEVAVRPREGARAARAALRAHRAMPTKAEPLGLLATLEEAAGRSAEGLELRRLALACEPASERRAQSYFNAAAAIRREGEALALLERRYARAAGRSREPATTYASALETLGRVDDAFAVLDAALAANAGDADLALEAAARCIRFGRVGRANELLDLARGRAARLALLRAEAPVRALDEAPEARAARRREILRLAPLDVENLRVLASLVTATDGPEAARALTRDHVAAHPHHHGLGQLGIEWERGAGPGAHLAAVERFVAMHPECAWAARELALALSSAGRRADAVAAAERAIAMDPRDAAGHNVLGVVLADGGRADQAAPRFLRACELAPDWEEPLRRAVEVAAAAPAARELLRARLGPIAAESTTGDGVRAWWSLARGLLEPAELAAATARVLRERPELLEAHLAAAAERRDARDAPGRRALLEEACRRFPHMVEPHRALARAAAEEGLHAAAAAALERATAVAPASLDAALDRADALERSDRRAEALVVLEVAARMRPLEESVTLARAGLLARGGDAAAARAVLERHAARAPAAEAVWRRLRSLAAEEGREAEAAVVAAAEAAAARRPWSGAGRAAIARMHADAGRFEQALAAARLAAAAEPRDPDHHDLAATLLAHLERFDEAVAACAPPAFGPSAPRALRARAAWVELLRGRLDQAAAGLRAVLAEDPALRWAWSKLALTHQQRGDHEARLEAAHALARLGPDDADAHDTLARAAFDAGLAALASRAFERAAALSEDPDAMIVDASRAALVAGDHARAGALLARAVAGESATPAALSAYARSRVVAGDAEAACLALRRLASRRSPEDAGVWKGAAQSVLRAAALQGQGEQAFLALDGLVEARALSPLLAPAWAEAYVHRAGASAARARMDAMPAGAAEVGHLAAAIGAAARRRFGLMGVAWILALRLPRLRRDRACYEGVARAIGDDSPWLGLLWLRGRRRRGLDLAPDVHLLAAEWHARIGLRGRAVRALRAGAAALAARRGEDAEGRGPWLQAFLALEEAVRGRHGEARRALDAVGEAELPARYAVLARLAREVLAIAAAPAIGRTAMIDRTKRALGDPDLAEGRPRDRLAIAADVRREIGRHDTLAHERVLARPERPLVAVGAAGVVVLAPLWPIVMKLAPRVEATIGPRSAQRGEIDPRVGLTVILALAIGALGLGIGIAIHRWITRRL